MEGLPGEGVEGDPHGLGKGAFASTAPPINGVADEGIAFGGEVDPDLVRPTRRKSALREGCRILEDAEDAIAGHRGFSAAAHHGHGLAVAGIAADGALDLALARLRDAPDDREIGALDPACREIGGERGVRTLGLGDDHEAARILVEPVHDPRPPHAAYPREALAAVREEGIDEGAVGISGSGMNDEARGLVEHQQRLILVADVQRDRLCLRRGIDGRRKRNLAALAWFDPQGGVRYGRAVHGYPALNDELLQAGAREIAEAARQHPIQALARLGLLDGGVEPVLPGFCLGRRGHGLAEWTRSMRSLKILVVVMGVMLVAGLAVVIGTIINRASQRQPSAAAGFGHSSVVLPAGARVVEMREAGDRLILRLDRSNGSQTLLIIDLTTGAEIGTIDLEPKP